MSINGLPPKDPVKLVNRSGNIDVVVFPNGLKGRAFFSPKFAHIESAMKMIGITVPNSKDGKGFIDPIQERRRIYLEDEDFGIAFYQLYYKSSMNPEDFQWEKIKS